MGPIEQIPALHRRANAEFSGWSTGITGDEWDDPTPCTLWSVRELLAHNVSENLWVPPLMAGGDRRLGRRPLRR